MGGCYNRVWVIAYHPPSSVGSQSNSYVFIYYYIICTHTRVSVPPINIEMDMDNCFRNLSKDGVIKALDDPDHCVVHRVKVGRKVRGKLWFSIANWDERAMDHIGKASGKLHRTIDIEGVLKFVKWDVGHNKEFTVGSVTLSQGEKGVPIGGFLSVQLCVLWGMYREGILLHETSLPLLLEQVQRKWDPTRGSLSLRPRGTLTFPNVVTVPKDRDEFHNSGMHGWVKPENKTFAGDTIDGFPIDIAAAVCLWDAHPEGRVGHLLRTAPKIQHTLLINYFSSIGQARCVTSEVS